MQLINDSILFQINLNLFIHFHTDLLAFNLESTQV